MPTNVSDCCRAPERRVILQELEDILDDDQDMEDMYLGRRRGEEAVDALQQMAQLAELHADGPQADDASEMWEEVCARHPELGKVSERIHLASTPLNLVFSHSLASYVCCFCWW